MSCRRLAWGRWPPLWPALCCAMWLVGPRLAQADPNAPRPPWVERDGGRLRVTADVRVWFSGPDTAALRLREKLMSGLTTTLHFDLEIRDGSQTVRARHLRKARVRWHLWDERFSATLDEPGGGSSPHFGTVDALVERLARFDAVPLDLNLANDETVHRVVLSLAINPVTAEESARMRQWLTAPAAQATLDPVSGTLLGSFVRFFDNIRPAVAEDRRALEGAWFRGDRLPFYRPAGSAPLGVPGSAPGSVPGSTPGSAPGSTPGSVPSSGPASTPARRPANAPSTTPASSPPAPPPPGVVPTATTPAPGSMSAPTGRPIDAPPRAPVPTPAAAPGAPGAPN